MINTIEDLLDDMIIPIGNTVKSLDLDDEAKVSIFIRELDEIVRQAKESEYGTD